MTYLKNWKEGLTMDDKDENVITEEMLAELSNGREDGE